MKKKQTCRMLSAVLLCTALLTEPYLPAEAAESFTLPDVTVGSVIYQENFSDTIAKGSLPEGWTTDGHVSWYNSNGSGQYVLTESGAIDPNKVNGDCIYQTTTEGVSGLYVQNAGSGDFAMKLPALVDSENQPVENYQYSLSLKIYQANGSVGVTTSFPGAADATHKGNSTFWLTYGKWASWFNTTKVVNQTDYTTMDGKISMGAAPDDTTFTVYHIDGVSYYYVNGTPIASLADTYYKKTDDLNGIGISMCVGAYLITDVTVKEIVIPEDPDRSTTMDYVEKGSVLESLLKNEYYVPTAVGKTIAPTTYSAQTIWTEDFAGYKEGTLPRGWDAQSSLTCFPYLWANNAADPSGFAVANADGTRGLLMTGAQNSSHILLMPEMASENYAIQMKVIGRCGYGPSVGIATNLTSDPAKSTSAIIAAFFPYYSEATTSVGTKLYQRANYADQKTVQKTIAECAADPWVEQTMTVVYIDGITHYYFNNTYIGAVEDFSKDGDFTRAGIYTCGGNFLVTEVTAMEIAPKKTQIKSDVLLGRTIYQMNAAQENPTADWATPVSGTWIPGTAGGTIQKTTDGIRMNAGAEDTFTAALLPALGTNEFCLEAEILLNSADGSFGLLTDLSSNTDAVGAQMAEITPNYAKGGLAQYRKTASNTSNLLRFHSMDVLGKKPAAGESYRLCIYQYQGNAYFFVNDQFISSRPLDKTAENDRCGIFTDGGDITVKNVKVSYLLDRGTTDAFETTGADIRYTDADGNTEGTGSSGLRFFTEINKKSPLYRSHFGNNDFVDLEENDLHFGELMIPKDILGTRELTADIAEAVDVPLEKVYREDSDTLTMTASLLDIPAKDLSRYVMARAYAKVRNGDGWEYVYEEDTIEKSPVQTANIQYQDTDNEAVRARLDEIFSENDAYLGAQAKTVTFELFSDFHYKEGLYITSVQDMEAIFERAEKADADFVVHAGDFCNDYLGSPELMKAYLENGKDMPVYGIYGNHELESANNSMQVVTPKLTNRADEVVWGTADGKIGDGSIGYYYFDQKGFRFIMLDTNYAWTIAEEKWEHYATNSYGPNYSTQNCEQALGDVQTAWLTEVLNDAAEKDIPCIVVGHDAFSSQWGSAYDAATVRAIFNEANRKNPGTVLAVINGHWHTDHQAVIDGIFYLDMNTTRNGHWMAASEPHYTDAHTFLYRKYDDEGNEISAETAPINDVYMGMQTYFFADPLSTTVTISDNGRIEVSGMQSRWCYDIVPPELAEGEKPLVTGGTYELPVH